MERVIKRRTISMGLVITLILQLLLLSTPAPSAYAAVQYETSVSGDTRYETSYNGYLQVASSLHTGGTLNGLVIASAKVMQIRYLR
jgi:hypothetical protein